MRHQLHPNPLAASALSAAAASSTYDDPVFSVHEEGSLGGDVD